MIISVNGFLYEAVRDVELLPNEPALMTLDEFLEFQNPTNKSHSDEAYNWNLAKMNDLSYRFDIYRSRYTNQEIIFKTINEKDGIFNIGNDTVAVILNGTLYHIKTFNPDKLSKNFFSNRMHGNSIDISYNNTKVVKYFDDVISKLIDIKGYNESKYDIIINRVKLANEMFTLRKDDIGDVALFNEDGYKVAVAQNEWGANLVSVASEYRNKGLGDYILKYWHEQHPNMTSGGYTKSGYKMDKRYWASRVKEFLANGWYSVLLKEGKITKEELSKIISTAKSIPTTKEFNEKEDENKNILIYADGVSFVIYDSKVYDEEEPNEDAIYAHGFMRSSDNKTYYYQIDYIPEFEKLATYVAMQMAYDNGEEIYMGPGYSDYFDYSDIPNVVENGQNIKLSKPIFDLKKYSKLEKTFRKSKDKYDEKLNTILELANSKW